MTSHSDILRQRGLYDAANEANWTPDGDGWRYPLYNLAGRPYAGYFRWKACDSSASPKYKWLPSKPAGIRYYLLPDTMSAIRDANGVVYIASGEPDVLAYRAAGFNNTLCWFGENAMPETFADDLIDHLHVSLVYVFPDLDAAGLRMAATVWKALQDTDIALRVLRLPGEVGSKRDINWLWTECKHNVDLFRMAVIDAPDIEDSTLDLYARPSSEPSNSIPSARADNSEIRGSFAEAILSDVEGRINKAHKWKRDGWSQLFNCVNPAHDDQNASASYNRDSHAYNCFVCGSSNAKQYGEWVGINIADYGRHNLDAVRAEQPVPSSSNGHEAEPIPSYTTSHEANMTVLDMLDGNGLGEPMEFPFQSFQRFGGFAEMMWPGKLVYVSGISGGGKTSLGEMFYEAMMRNSYDSIWYGPEWSAVEMRLRALQRAGGLTLTQMAKYQIYMRDFQSGIPPGKCRGEAPPAGALQRSKEIVKMIDAWPGRAYYLNPAAGLNDMTTVLQTFEDIVDKHRAEGRNVKGLFFDYLQRAPKGGQRGWDWSELVVGQIKSFCERKNLFGFIFIQPTKGASAATRDGAALTESAGQGISDQQSNLYITMTPHFHEDRSKKPYVQIDIVKNSMGKTGSIKLKWAFHKLCVVDEEYVEPGNVFEYNDDGRLENAGD